MIQLFNNTTKKMIFPYSELLILKYIGCFLLSIAMLFLMLSLTSCNKDSDDDISDDTGTSYLETKYGTVTPTGSKTFNLYARRSDGPTELKIPGFSTIYCLLNYIDAPYLASEDDANEFSRGNNYWEKTSSSSCIVRIATLNSSSIPYVYAKIELLENLYGPDNKKIGLKLRYESPVELEE